MVEPTYLRQRIALPLNLNGCSRVLGRYRPTSSSKKAYYGDIQSCTVADSKIIRYSLELLWKVKTYKTNEESQRICASDTSH